MQTIDFVNSFDYNFFNTFMGGIFVDFKQLTYIITIAEEHNLTKAAERLFVSQSTLSLYLNKLERELGVALFTRNKNRLTITPEGEEYVKTARKILELRNDLYKKLKISQNQFSISIGISCQTLFEQFGQIYADFHEIFPNISVRVTEGWSKAIIEKLYDEKGIAGSSASLVMQAPAGPGNGYEGWSTWQPTYEIVELFQNADGTPYKPAETKPFTILQTTIDPDSGEATQKEVTIQASDVNPWEGREIRLKANILYDGMLWGYGDSNREIELFEAGAKGVIPGKDSRTGETWWNGTKTGYNMRKFLSSHINFYDDTVVDTTPWFFIRLAEVYLNYAECQIELGNNAEALKYINLIRNRALLPDATGKDIRTEYEYERTVELMFEGQRFFDLRRWKKMEETYSKEHWPTGLKIYKLQNGTKIYYHNPEAVQQRNFDASKNYWWPIPRYELNKSTLLDAAPYE